MKCPFCGSDNPDDVKVCLNCGQGLNDFNTFNISQVVLDFSNEELLQNQIKEYFFKLLRFRIETELDAKAYRQYFDLYHSSGFYNKFDLRSQQLTEELVDSETSKNDSGQKIIQKDLNQILNTFIDFFIIVYCQPLHKMNLPSAILRYEKVDEKTLDLKEMILAFLDFDNEKDKIYKDIVAIPSSKMRNAKEAFLFSQHEENIIFLSDQTVFGSCKEGFAMTDKAIYWKAHFNEASKVAYKDLERIKKEGEWITINDYFFNVNKVMNYKMMKLLQKLRNLNVQ